VQILPVATPLTQPYWDGAREHKLLYQQCRRCGANWHPPMPICPTCHSSDVEWRPASGGGSVYTFTIVEHPTHPAFTDRVPYVVAVVELDEGPRVVTNVRDCAIEDVRGAMRVRIIFEDIAEGVTLPQAAPA
jgi:uncharacterized OB-fold protein